MKNYRAIYRALSMKNALNVLTLVYNGNVVKNYMTFGDLKQMLKSDEYTLRRITNSLSRVGLIKSIKKGKMTDEADGRKRVYVIDDLFLYKKIMELTDYIME